MLVGVPPILALEIDSSFNFVEAKHFPLPDQNLDVEDVQKGSVEPWIAGIPTLGLSQVDDLANSVHWRIVHLRSDFVNKKCFSTSP